MTKLKYLSIEDWKKAPTDDALIRKAFVSKIEDGGQPRTKRFTITTGAVDRDGDTIDVSGWDIAQYVKNPVVLWAHDSRSLPIGKALEVITGPDKLSALDEFTTRDLNPLGDMVFNLVDQGFLNAVSVGFRPTKWAFNEDRGSGGWMPAYDFMEQELLEHSVVPVPANPEALIEARSAGVDLTPMKAWAEEILSASEGEGLWLPRNAVERAFKIADGEKKWFSVNPVKSNTGTIKVRVELENGEELEKQIHDLAERAKSGRVLSAANEALLIEARDNLDSVLAQIDQESSSSTPVSKANEDDLELKDDSDDGIELEDEEEYDIDANELRAALTEAGKSFWAGVSGRLD